MPMVHVIQVYMRLKTCDKWDDISSSIEAHIEDTSIWMISKMPKWNKDKTEFTVFHPSNMLRKLRIFTLRWDPI